MKLKNLYIEDYKKFKQTEISFHPEDGINKFYKKLYGNLNFSVLVGENGVGKTTIMSFLTEVFHNLQRYHDRISSDFILKYEIKYKNEFCEVELCKENKNIFISVDKHLSKSLLLEWNYDKKGYYRKNHQKDFEDTTTYKEIKQFLPCNIIASVFSLHREYPKERVGNYIGDEIINHYDVSKIYGENHYEIKSFSKGIIRFLKSYFKNNSEIEKLFQIFSFNEIVGFKVYFNIRELDLYGKKNFIKEDLINIEINELKMILNSIEDYSKVNSQKKILSCFLSNINSIKQDELDFFTREETKGLWLSIDNLYEEDFKKLLLLAENELIYFNDLLFKKDNHNISLDNMSSGEKMFIIRILSILSSINDNSLVIIEEPELHLNPSWTKQIITIFELLFKNYDAHFLIASHTYSFINTLFPENILLIENNKISHPDFNTFLANEQEINSNLFKNSNIYNYTEEKLINKIEEANIKDLKELISYLGESFFRFIVFKKIAEIEEE